uniref:Uncharacterized protein n=1 Tax=Romanomermis culicivorax TaxID=13658 RepID=A0A915HM36_ROMCU
MTETNCTCDCPEDKTEKFSPTVASEAIGQKSEMTENQLLKVPSSQPTTESFLFPNGPSLQQIITAPSKDFASSSTQKSTASVNIERVEKIQEEKRTGNCQKSKQEQKK